MLLRLLDSKSSEPVTELDVPSITFDTRDSTFCVPGGSLLVAVRTEARPLSISLSTEACALQFRTSAEALEFANALRLAITDANRRNERLLD